MSAPGRKRRPKGDAKGGSLEAKDDKATAQQRQARAELVARMRERNRKPL